MSAAFLAAQIADPSATARGSGSRGVVSIPGIIPNRDRSARPIVLNPKKGARPCEEMASIGKRIEVLRTARGMTQVDLAQVAGMGQNSVSRYESGKQKPSREAVAALAAALGVHPAAIEYGALPALPAAPMGPVLSAFLGSLEGRSATPEEVVKLQAADAVLTLETPIACHYALQAIRQRRD